MTDTVATPPAETGKRMIRRHPLVVRITHWVNVVCVIFLLMSGLQIFNAHPHLYWGETSTFNANNQSVDTVLSIGAIRGADGEPQGVVRLFGAISSTPTASSARRPIRARRSCEPFPPG